jgi:PAS domain S-box-containing protein
VEAVTIGDMTAIIGAVGGVLVLLVGAIGQQILALRKKTESVLTNQEVLDTKVDKVDHNTNSRMERLERQLLAVESAFTHAKHEAMEADTTRRLLVQEVEQRAPVCIVLTATGHVQDWNAAATKLLGWLAAEVLGKEFATLAVPAALRAKHRESLQAFRAGEPSRIIGQPFRTMALCKDGREIPVELLVTVIGMGATYVFQGIMTPVAAPVPPLPG